jgi:hypothetical protein
LGQLRALGKGLPDPDRAVAFTRHFRGISFRLKCGQLGPDRHLLIDNIAHPLVSRIDTGDACSLFGRQPSECAGFDRHGPGSIIDSERHVATFEHIVADPIGMGVRKHIKLRYPAQPGEDGFTVGQDFSSQCCSCFNSKLPLL